MEALDNIKLPACVAVIIQKEDQILLLRRQNTGWMNGFWGLAGGMLDPQETIAEAAVRETYEEVGLVVKPEDLELMHVMHVHGEKDIFVFFFVAHRWEGEPENREPQYCDSVQWFPLNALPSNTIPQTRLALEYIKTGNTYSERSVKH